MLLTTEKLRAKLKATSQPVTVKVRYSSWRHLNYIPCLEGGRLQVIMTSALPLAPAQDIQDINISDNHASTSSLPAALRPSPSVRKNQFVSGIVQSVDVEGAMVQLQSGDVGHLSWRKYSKLKMPEPPEDDTLRTLPFAPGDKIWAYVLEEGKTPIKLGTAALEVRPGDMLKRKAHVFAVMEQWAARAGTMPLYQWRGQLELQQFLADGELSARAKAAKSKGASSKQAAAKSDGISTGLGSDVWGLGVETGLQRRDIVKGEVMSVRPFGAFVRLDSRSDGLLPLSLLSKTYSSAADLHSALKPGDEVLAVVRRLVSEDEEATAVAEASESRSRQMTAAASSSQRVPEVASGRLRYILSTRALEAEEGLIKKDLRQYNERAHGVHKDYNVQDSVENLAASRSHLAGFKEKVSEWSRGTVLVRRGAIVKGEVVQMTGNAVFVRTEYGAVAMVHEDDLSCLKIKKIRTVIQVGDVVYGRLYNHPTNTLEANESAAASPTSLWMSVKSVEISTHKEGLLLRDSARFWEVAKAKYQKEKERQKLQQDQIDGKSSFTYMTVHRTGLDMRELLAAVIRLGYIDWGLLAGRPDPGLSLNVATPPVKAWSAGPSSELCRQFHSLRHQVLGAAVQVLPKALTWLLLPREPELPGAGSRSTRGTEGGDQEGSSSSGASDETEQQEPPEWLQDVMSEAVVPNVTRHAWTTCIPVCKDVVTRLVVLRLRAAAVSYACAVQDSVNESSAGEPSVGVVEELREAASRAIMLGSLMGGGASGRDMALEVYGVLLALGLSFPQVVIDGLLLWGWALYQYGEQKGTTSLQGSTVLELLAVSKTQPPLSWTGPIFKQLYSSMMTSERSADVMRYFRLMHALGYKQEDYGWWDRFLQRFYYERSAETPMIRRTGLQSLLAHEVQELRDMIPYVSPLR
ncbi:hypothetical protein CEUSTIGMA_g12847.t1 [Chlamydomonas eustigma]|uniref:S1 motif domain-containing protein n=1 Tax=Chlamydomonas eustigma TaxID=1157962 RepID=A0A250XQS5_9CHLO|nr:hypothetical protein CEUSTIGMA_g12847.t1 [Chlamydomonas eustigma]|eukprot:GAX85431.1 hypothetical protein CEUSTIGMA_g12847.t1 [Chlamydomonas eustigma]